MYDIPTSAARLPYLVIEQGSLDISCGHKRLGILALYSVFKMELSFVFRAISKAVIRSFRRAHIVLNIQDIETPSDASLPISRLYTKLLGASVGKVCARARL